MRKIALIALVCALVGSVSPTAAEERDIPGLLLQAPNRYTAREVGKPTDMSFVFGPYTIPAGQDSNRITLDLPLNQGFITAVAPTLLNAATGEMPSMQEAHIHHAHWFRVTSDSEQEYYTGFADSGMSWVFGTGEEATQGRMDDRARVDQAHGNNWDYGIQVDATTPNALIYMIHNKTANTETFFVTLDVTFIPGTREQIKEVTGRDIHPLYGQLWGQTKDVEFNDRKIGADWEVTRDGVAVAAASHLHPGGKATIVSNLGKRDPDTGQTACETAEKREPGAGDPDGDGFLGVAILDSYKYDRVMETWPYSENYQMGASKFGWRAPLHAGDVLRQEATYALDASGKPSTHNRASVDGVDHHWYEAMTYTGIFMDREYKGLKTPAGVCSVAALKPRLLGEDTFKVQGYSGSWRGKSAHEKHGHGLAKGVAEVKEDWNYFLPRNASRYDRARHGMVNHIWHGEPEPLCALPGMPGLADMPKCGPKDIETTPGPAINQVHVAGFTYVPGDLNAAVGGVQLPQVSKGTNLEFINEDVATNVRHTFTSCAWPCVGTYVSNFPNPDGGPQAFDTGKIGNLDPIDGGITGDDTVPHYTLDTSELDPGKYAYYCRIHPWMRGGFEIVK